MINLAFFAFFAILIAFGLKRPFIWVLCYIYIDIVSPQVISWGFFSHIPASLIAFAAAFLGWLFIDPKTNSRFTLRQGILLALLLYCGMTTLSADFPAEAQTKWAWVWKALIFAIFLPLTLHSRLRIEAAALTIVLAASALIIDGGIKTALGGGGYGTLIIFVANNTGLYEGSILSCAAITIIPLAMWLAKYGTIFPPDWRVWTFAVALIFACVLIPIGTQARTGLVCLAALCLLFLRTAKYRTVFMAGMSILSLLALPFLPQQFVERMTTIENHQSDQSAGTRIGVWKWTLDYVQTNPLGGGFEAYLANKIEYDTVKSVNSGSNVITTQERVVEQGRAYHSSYFEMLGEQGYPGLALWLLLHGTGLIQMELIRRRWKQSSVSQDADTPSPFNAPDTAWISPLAKALQLAQAVYLVGSLFVGIAFQPFALMLISLQCGLWSYTKRRGHLAGESAPHFRHMQKIRL